MASGILFEATFFGFPNAVQPATAVGGRVFPLQFDLGFKFELKLFGVREGCRAA